MLLIYLMHAFAAVLLFLFRSRQTSACQHRVGCNTELEPCWWYHSYKEQTRQPSC